jgi:hypothetical protein
VPPHTLGHIRAERPTPNYYIIIKFEMKNISDTEGLQPPATTPLRSTTKKKKRYI